MKTLTQERLKELLEYDPKSGLFMWRTTGPGRRIGRQAGHKSVTDGYQWIRIDKNLYQAHRLAFLYVNGRMPSEDIDHKTMKRDDNRYENLREATRGQNSSNCNVRPHCLSGLKGVHWDKQKQKWYVRIRKDNKIHWLGYYEDKYEAAFIFDKAAIRLHGDFAVTNFPRTLDL